MFYSQFILAKKGPLGTIWIAAHLERKLRKNQVADTDIGFSVDSILFPDAPIALRLSSHLLLGVVRIYSRKVNYLFDDCSEALLKIKQAFRSTAVDLPPEESTAPYHSITLPETFDLDDFELPDSDIFQGNYVDHHVSTKEQITLQDTMDGVVYSTSKFGLDERFGDGDTSQVALDLEEDIFLDKVTARPGDILDADAGTSDVAPAQFVGSSAPVLPRGTLVNLEAGDYAQAPSTPGLVNEPNLSSVQERLASDDHLELEDHNLTESVGMDGRGNASDNLDFHSVDEETCFLPDKHANDDPTGTMGMITKENSLVSTDVEVSKEDVSEKSLANKLAVNDVEDEKNASNNEPGASMDGEPGEYIEVRLQDLKDNGVDVEGQEGHGIDFCPEAQARLEPEESISLNNLHKDEQPGSSSISVLRACSLLSDIPLEDGPHSLDKDEELEKDQELGKDEPHTLKEDGRQDPFETFKNIQGEGHVDIDNGQVEKIQLVEPDSAMPSDNQFGELDGSMTSELPVPEKLLSAPQVAVDMPVSLHNLSTPDKEDQEEADGSSAVDKISNKKRTFMDSMETVQSMNTAETFNMSKSRRTVGSIPDDDDLLSSILAGRSSTLKIKPSPAALEVSRKRVRATSRTSAMKRKVLVDDSMVLLGDTIRQQLTNTEGIRRLRKKAPCTRTEIVIIQRQFLEEEIFSDPVLNGMALELTRLHNEKLDLSGIDVTANDGNTGSLETRQGSESSPGHALIEDGFAQGDLEPSNSKDEQCKEVPVQGENQPGECQQLHQDSSGIGVIPDVGAPQVEPLGEITDMEVDRANNLLGKRAPGSPLGSENEPMLLDKTADEYLNVAMETAVMPCDKNGTQSCKNDPSLSSTISGENLDGANILENCTDNLAVAGADLREDKGNLLESETKELVEIAADVQINANALNDDIGPAFVHVLSENEGCLFADSLNVVLAPELESDKQGFNEGGVAVSSGYDDKDQFSADSRSGDCRLGTGPDADIKDHDVECAVGCEADQLSPMNTDHPSDGHYAEGHFPEPQDISFADDTGFLNVDDDELVEDDEDMPGAEDAQLLDNSGWSSRTRAVANFLQTLFDKEAEHGRKFLPMDRLLTGKTRKEASRMFFEALVLKTKDYIHVDQENSFENINITARAKLMKSDF